MGSERLEEFFKSSGKQTDEVEMSKTDDESGKVHNEESDKEDSEESNEFAFADSLFFWLAVPTFKFFLKEALPCAHNYG